MHLKQFIQIYYTVENMALHGERQKLEIRTLGS